MLLGLQLCGFSVETIARNCYATILDRFKGKYYVTPTVASKLFEDIQDESAARINKPSPKYLLLALFYLKKYPTKSDMAGFLNTSERTAMHRSKEYVDAMQGLISKKIRWIFDDPSIEEVFIVSVDGIHCRIQEPQLEPSSKWYSKKSNRARLVYEISMALCTLSFYCQAIS